jgi:hypothetical protein
VAEWLKAADCKSARDSVRWFESSPLHHEPDHRTRFSDRSAYAAAVRAAGLFVFPFSFSICHLIGVRPNFRSPIKLFQKFREIQWAHSAIRPMRHFKTSPKSVVSIRLILDQTRKNKLYEKSKGSPPFADIHLIRPQRSGSWHWGAAPDLDVADSSGQNGGSRRYT